MFKKLFGCLKINLGIISVSFTSAGGRVTV